MKYAKIALFILGVCLSARAAGAAQPMPGYEPTVTPPPGDAYPAQLPQYLPNGAPNLDEAWTQYGGARLYWNSVRIPRQLKLNGATWVDPASVPELTLQPPAKKAVKRAWRPARKRVARRTVASKRPAKRMTSRKLGPAVARAPQQSVIAPLTPAPEILTAPIEPPRLQ